MTFTFLITHYYGSGSGCVSRAGTDERSVESETSSNASSRLEARIFPASAHTAVSCIGSQPFASATSRSRLDRRPPCSCTVGERSVTGDCGPLPKCSILPKNESRHPFSRACVALGRSSTAMLPGCASSSRRSSDIGSGAFLRGGVASRACGDPSCGGRGKGGGGDVRRLRRIRPAVVGMQAQMMEKFISSMDQ